MDNYESEFSKKNILITGASSGVGLYSAFYFLNQNANVILACQDEISVIKLLEKYNFKNAYILKADLEKLGQIKTFINYITEIFTSIDILINCAGIKLDNDILTTHSEDFDYTMNTNLRSVFILIKELRPYFSAAEMAYLNIRINAISACPINTNSLRYINISEKEIKEFNKKMEKNIPLGRIAEGDDIVKVIIFLASKRSKKITGQIIKVDGGRGLTSSGYVHYKGLFNMNSKIEPDKDIILQSGDICYNLCEKNKIMDKPITDKNELKKFVEKTIKNSNFSTRNMEAFYNVKNDYYQVENNNNLLSQKFLTDESKNELLKLNSEKEIEYDIKNVNINCYNNDNDNINENKINNNKSIKMSENIELKPYDEEIFIHGKENIDENEIQNQNK